MGRPRKFIRDDISEDPQRRGKQIRSKIGRNLKLDVSEYQRAYPDKKLMLISDYGTDVQNWLDSGAEPVPRVSVERTIYKGINDKQSSEWVTFVGGKDRTGNLYNLVLLMIDPDLYNEIKIEPEKRRQQGIEQAMKLGANQSDISKHLPGGGGVQTYAPNLPVGTGTGFNTIRN